MKKRRYLLFLCIMALLFTVAVFSKEQTPKYSSDPTATPNPVTVLPEQIINNLYMAGSLGKINDMTVDMEIYGPPYSKDTDTSKEPFKRFANVKLSFLAPNKVRTEHTITMNGTSMDIYIIRITDGRIVRRTEICGWTKSEIDDHHHSSYLPFNIDTQPQDQYRKYSLLREEKLDGRDAYVITVDNEKDPHIKFLTVWIDKELLIPLKEEHVKQDNKGTEIKNTILYKEPKQIPDGRWIPFRIERYEDDKMKAYILYKSVIINQGLSEDLF